MTHHAQFAKMTFNNGNSLFLNTEYITAYGYLKDRDETVVSVLSEAKEVYFPGDQTEEIIEQYRRADGLQAPPERKTAHWVFGNTMGHSWMKCSECCVSQSGNTGCWTYCPNCGAEMKGETEVEID